MNVKLELYGDVCFFCGGDGKKYNRPAWILDREAIPGKICEHCEGWGRELGIDGQAIVEFLDARFGLTMKKRWEVG